MTKRPHQTTDMIALGVAGYALSMELLSKLTERGFLSHDEGASIIDAALAALEATDGQTPHPTFRLARVVLDGQLAGWQRQRPE